MQKHIKYNKRGKKGHHLSNGIKPMYWFQSLSCGSPEAPNNFPLEDYVTACVNLK